MSKEKIEGYLINLGLSFEEVGENSWLITDQDKGLEQVVVVYEDPLIVVRVKVMDLPKSGREAFYKKLLEINASDLLHGAYALDNESVILIDTLQSADVNLEAFQASLDGIGLALTQHYPVLSKFREQ